MTEVALYLDLASPPCRAVYFFAKANKIPFKNNVVLLAKGEHLSEEFGKVNPLRKVPALKDGDFTMGESYAILLYLIRKFKTPDHWYPSDLQKRARVDEYLAWHFTNARPGTSKLFWLKGMTPYVTGHEVNPEKLNAALCEFKTISTTIQDVFLQDKPFLVGDEVSIADVVVLADIGQTCAAELDVFEDYPKLAAWKQRVKEAVGVELFNEAQEGIANFRETQKQAPPELKERLKARVEYFSR
ncbi:glutathione S-transferase theta-1-like [Eleutherodactylus coqui]|uniref:glutathione S-transferase theta-1-like n=1 Tax=Eleutherodactylus coqui TaxID=57060 RepID=UPI0034622A01